MQSFDNALKGYEQFESLKAAALADLYKERDAVNEKIKRLEGMGRAKEPKKRGRPPKETKKGDQ